MDPHPSPRVGLSALLLGLCAACGHGGGRGGGSGATAPHDLAYAGLPAVWLLATSGPVLTPEVEGTVEHWSITPALPAGLELDPASGVLSGTPSAPAPRRKYTVVASNDAGTAACEVELVVVEPPRFAYLASREDGTISTFVQDFEEGRLSRKGFLVPPDTESGPERIALHPSGRFAYVPNLATENVSVYRVDAASGALLRGAPVAVGAGPHSLAIDPSGRFACVASRASAELAVFAIDEESGALSPVGAPLETAGTPAAIAFDPGSRHLFLALSGAANSIQALAFDSATGALAAGGPELSLGSSQPTALVVDPARPSVYLLLASSAGVLALAYDPETGVLTASPVDPTGAAPASIVFDPTGRFAWVANAGAGTISCFRADANGELLATATVACTAGPLDLEIDPLGRSLYAVGSAAGVIERYAIEAETGLLELAGTVATRANPTDLALQRGATVVAWIPRTVHAANRGSATVSTYDVAPASGALVQHGSPLLSGLEPVSIALDPWQRWMYVANRTSATLARFTLDPLTGTPLEGGAPSGLQGEATHVAVDPSGRFLFVCAEHVVAADDGWLSTFSIDQATGALALLHTREVGSRPSFAGTDPTGTFLYVANHGTGLAGTSSIDVLRIDAATGALSQEVPRRFVPGVYAFAFHPDGLHAYAAMRTADITIHYAIDRQKNGELVFQNGARAALEPTAVSITPDGRFAYVAYHEATGSGAVGMFRIDADDGRLVTPAEVFFDGTQPLDLAVEPSGRFLYVANEGSDTVSVATIGADGMLDFGVPVTSGVRPSALVVGAVTQ